MAIKSFLAARDAALLGEDMFLRATVVALILLVSIVLVSSGVEAQEKSRTQTFDQDPRWEGVNNRMARQQQPVNIEQDFGYSRTANAGGKAGEIGGRVHAAGEAAFYGKVINEKTFDMPMTASGKLAIADGGTHLLLGFFNARTVNEWRTPNTVAIRINGRGDHFFAYVEYCTAKWRAGGDTTPFPSVTNPDTGKSALIGFPSGKKAHTWSLRYDPKANNGMGVVTASIDGKTAVCKLDAGHKADGAAFNRFGILNVTKSADNATEIWLDDVVIDGRLESFDEDPKWEGRNNRAKYQTRLVRPWFDFGWSETNFCGGEKQGELGGIIYRGDCRYPERMACYADKVGPLTLDKPIRASGKVVLLRGVSDSTTLFGFFNMATAMKSNPSQSQGIPEGVLGVHIEGPSREGFKFYPVTRMAGADGAYAHELAPHIWPDGKVRQWKLEYDPQGADGKGRVSVWLDGKSAFMDLKEGEKGSGTTFDRFGIVTPWIDGNGQTAYFDDITYSVGQ